MEDLITVLIGRLDVASMISKENYLELAKYMGKFCEFEEEKYIDMFWNVIFNGEQMCITSEFMCELGEHNEKDFCKRLEVIRTQSFGYVKSEYYDPDDLQHSPGCTSENYVRGVEDAHYAVTTYSLEHLLESLTSDAAKVTYKNFIKVKKIAECVEQLVSLFSELKKAINIP